MNKPNYHLLEVKYLSPTDTKGSKVKITSFIFKESRMFSFDSKFSRASDHALAWCENIQGLNIIGIAEGDCVDYLISDTFKPFFK